MIFVYNLFGKPFANSLQISKIINIFYERAISAASNTDVSEIYHASNGEIPGESVIFESIFYVINFGEDANYPIELLDLLEISGVPPQLTLSLKIEYLSI